MMAYSNAKLKSNSDKASPSFRPFCIENASERFYLFVLYYGFYLNTFQLAKLVHMHTKFNENIVQYFSPHCAIGLLRIYK
jgi:hypothetical protein